MVILWSMQIICSVAGCKFKTPLGLGDDLKEMLHIMKMHEQLNHQPPVRETGDTKIDEGILKKDLMSLLECPVCLDVFKPPLQVFNFCFAKFLSFIIISSRYGNVQRAMSSVGNAEPGLRSNCALSVVLTRKIISLGADYWKSYPEWSSLRSQEETNSQPEKTTKLLPKWKSQRFVYERTTIWSGHKWRLAQRKRDKMKNVTATAETIFTSFWTINSSCDCLWIICIKFFLLCTNMLLLSDIQSISKEITFKNFNEDHTSWYSRARRFLASYLENNWGNLGDDEATGGAAGQPDPSGGDDTKEGTNELAWMSCLSGSFQTSLTGI